MRSFHTGNWLMIKMYACQRFKMDAYIQEEACDHMLIPHTAASLQNNEQQHTQLIAECLGTLVDGIDSYLNNPYVSAEAQMLRGKPLKVWSGMAAFDSMKNIKSLTQNISVPRQSSWPWSTGPSTA